MTVTIRIYIHLHSHAYIHAHLRHIHVSTATQGCTDTNIHTNDSIVKPLPTHKHTQTTPRPVNTPGQLPTPPLPSRPLPFYLCIPPHFKTTRNCVSNNEKNTTLEGYHLCVCVWVCVRACVYLDFVSLLCFFSYYFYVL